MLTIGYGDISATNDVERVFIIIIACLTCGVFGYSINAIGTIFADI